MALQAYDRYCIACLITGVAVGAVLTCVILYLFYVFGKSI